MMSGLLNFIRYVVKHFLFSFLTDSHRPQINVVFYLTDFIECRGKGLFQILKLLKIIFLSEKRTLLSRYTGVLRDEISLGSTILMSLAIH